MKEAHVRVLVASRSPVWAAGLAAFLSVPPLEPSVAFTVDDALERLAAAPHALAVIERRLADAPGAELAAEIRRRHPGVALLAAVDNASPQSQLEALAAGACGCLLPTWTREAVLEAVGDALRGVGRFEGPARRPMAAFAHGAASGESLTAQERVVLRLMRQHLTYKEIALRLGLSWHTVRTHAQSILRKSGVHSRRDLEFWDARAAGPVARAATEAAR